MQRKKALSVVAARPLIASVECPDRSANRRSRRSAPFLPWDRHQQPGIALLTDLHITESKVLEFRAELFNAFNHAEFNNRQWQRPRSTFGEILGAGAPRIGQLALKFTF